MLVIDIISLASSLMGLLLALFILCIIWRRRDERTIRPFILLLISILIWSTGYILEMLSQDYNLKILATKFAYIGITVLPVSWFIFSSLYTQKFTRWLESIYMYLLFVIPTATVILVFTNEFHNLVWHAFSFSKIGDLEILTPKYGWWFWVHAVYSYIILILGSLFLIHESFLYPELYGKKTILLTSAAIIPMISNILYISRMLNLDFTPESFSISSLLLFLGIYRLRLLHIIPIARNEIMENMRDAVIVFDKENRIVDMNKSAEVLLSIEKDKVIGKKAFEVLLGCEDIIAFLREDEGKKICNKSGQFYEVNIGPIKDRKGEKLGKIMIVRDITDIKKYEMELERLNKNLESEVRRRTAEVEMLLKQKDDFINQLGHDLKTPLTPILSLLPLIKERVEDEDTKRLIDISLRNARYMKNLVVDILNLARLNMPDVKFDIRDINLNDVLEESIKDNEIIIKKKNITPINNVNGNIFVKADKLRLKEVFTNLISNSVKYTPEGGRIEFFARRNGREVIVEVKDNGIGLEGDQKLRIFEEFYKVDESRHDIESSGLGLAICKRIVEKHNGKIWAESEGLGKGTSIYFTLPIGDGSGKEEDTVSG